MTLTDPVSPDLKRHLRTLKLGQLLATLPDRLTLARQNKLPHADFLELLLSDEVTRRENGSAARRARAAGLDPDMRLDTWDPSAAVRYDQQLWNELVSLRFAEAAHGALVLGPVGVGKTHLATALGHIAVRRRLTVHMARAGHLFKRLKAARLDNSTEAEHRRLAAVNLLIIDDFALQPLDETATTDFYELTVARHRTQRHRRHLQPDPGQSAHVRVNLWQVAPKLHGFGAVDRLTRPGVSAQPMVAGSLPGSMRSAR